MALPEKFITPEAYLEFERASEERHEYFNGKVFPMVSNQFHSLVIGNTGASLHGQLRNRPYDVFMVAMRLKTPSGLYAYPDIVVADHDAPVEDSMDDTLLTARVLVEVYTPLTDGYDQGRKFQHYRTLDSLQEYVLIAQDEIYVERYQRRPTGDWLLSEATDINATLDLPSIQCRLALADIYEKMTFEDQESGSYSRNIGTKCWRE